MERLDVLPALRARRPLEVAQAEVGDPVGAAHALVLRRRGLGGRRVLDAAVTLLADAVGRAARVLHALLVRPADPVEARVCKGMEGNQGRVTRTSYVGVYPLDNYFKKAHHKVAIYIRTCQKSSPVTIRKMRPAKL